MEPNPLTLSELNYSFEHAWCAARFTELALKRAGQQPAVHPGALGHLKAAQVQLVAVETLTLLPPPAAAPVTASML